MAHDHYTAFDNLAAVDGWFEDVGADDAKLHLDVSFRKAAIGPIDAASFVLGVRRARLTVDFQLADGQRLIKASVKRAEEAGGGEVAAAPAGWGAPQAPIVPADPERVQVEPAHTHDRLVWFFKAADGYCITQPPWSASEVICRVKRGAGVGESPVKAQVTLSCRREDLVIDRFNAGSFMRNVQAKFPCQTKIMINQLLNRNLDEEGRCGEIVRHKFNELVLIKTTVTSPPGV